MDTVFSVYGGILGSVYYGCGTGMCVLEGEKVQEIGVQQGLPPDRWDAILGDLDGNLWVRSATSLYERRAGTAKFELRPGVPKSNNTYPTLALDPAGALLVPTYKGLARAHTERLGTGGRGDGTDRERHLGCLAGSGRIDLARIARIRARALARLQRMAGMDNA